MRNDDLATASPAFDVLYMGMPRPGLAPARVSVCNTSCLCSNAALRKHISNRDADHRKCFMNEPELGSYKPASECRYGYSNMFVSEDQLGQPTRQRSGTKRGNVMSQLDGHTLKFLVIVLLLARSLGP